MAGKCEVRMFIMCSLYGTMHNLYISQGFNGWDIVGRNGTGVKWDRGEMGQLKNAYVPFHPTMTF